jgi:hypothetical protein
VTPASRAREQAARKPVLMQTLLPGSQPTTAQVAQTPGATDLQNALRNANPVPFDERAAQQNSARLAAINSVAPTGSPEAVGQFAQQHLADIDRAGQQAVAGAQAAVQAATENLGGQATAADIGANIRAPLMAANKVAKASATRLWNAIDPDGKLVLPTGDVPATAQNLLASVSPEVGDVLDPRESLLLNSAAKLPDSMPFQQVKQLRSNIGAAERQLVATPGNDQSLRRLGILKSSLDDAISGAATQAAQADPSVAARLATLGGANDTSITTLGNNERNAGGGPAVSPRDNGASSAGFWGPAAPPGRGAVPPGIRAGGAGGNGSPASGGGSPASGGGVGNFPQESLGKYLEARQATYNQKQTYNQGPVGQVLRPGQYGAPYRVEDAAVTAKFLNGTSSPAAVAAYINAVGGDANAVSAMREGLVRDLRDKGIVKQDGTIDSGKFATWQARRRDTIKQFPGLSDEFAGAQKAQDTLDRAVAKHESDKVAFQRSAAWKFVGADPLKAVAAADRSANPAATWDQLASLVHGKPDAEAGLKRAVVDHILNKTLSSRPADEVNDFLKPATFRHWIADRSPALKKLFGGQGVQNLEAVAADLRRQQYRPGVTGSNTAANLFGAKCAGLMAEHGSGVAGTSALGLLAGHLGEELLGGHGLIVGGATVLGKLLYSSFKQHGIETMNDLLREAMLHPQIARELLQKVPSGGMTPAFAARIARVMQGTAVGAAAQQGAGARQMRGATQ